MRILGPNFEVGSKKDLNIKAIQRVVIMMGRYTETVADIPAGNTCGLIGVDGFILKNATITNLDTACCIKSMKVCLNLQHSELSTPRSIPSLTHRIVRCLPCGPSSCSS